MEAKTDSTRLAASTVEVPLTPAMYKLIGADLAKKRRKVYIIFGAIAAFLVLMGLWLEVFLIMLASAIFFILIGVGAAAWLGRATRRDLAEKSFLRTTGSIGVHAYDTTSSDAEVGSGATVYTLILDGAKFSIDRSVATKIDKLSWGTVDHSKHAHVVFEVLDENGQPAYRCPGYQPGL